MGDQEVLAILDELRSGGIEEYRVQKTDFLHFRKHLIAQEDFKHFRGIAQQGGDIIYTYMEKPRS
ncbi:hypothetical protein D3H55_17080 [Bacillus salacetis]|uniref:Abortive phage infection protein n=1 Tax=Bacillus salacetis TaxID=2315464 RepID=A0A3A1QUN8_9BACI|nr:hypothetical protein [Bacillus salacetis]RIW30159.1 hypothetical protein D3H55_17080 [Bacillus salacetis]